MASSPRVAIYARVSTERQLEGYGLEVQIEQCRRHATSRGLVVHDEVFVDEGISGAHGVAHRAALDKMITTAKSGAFEYVLIHEVDRIAREEYIGMSIIGDLGSSGIRVIEASSGETFEGIALMMAMMKLFSASDDRRKILSRTKLGQIRRAKAGKVSGPPPLGYDKTEDGHLKINEDEAALVRRIFQLYTEGGYNFDSLAKLMNDEGIVTKRARLNAEGKNRYRGADRWQRSTIEVMIGNPVYKGTYVYGKTAGKIAADREYRPSAKRPVTSKDVMTAHKNRAFLPHEKVEVEVPAIIDEAMWERAQALRSERYIRTYLAKGTAKHSYTFDGLVKCSLCGRRMIRSSQKRQTKKHGERVHYYYHCTNKDHACPNNHHRHRLEIIDVAIMATILPYLRDPELVRRSLEDTVAQNQRQHTALEAQRDALQKRLDEHRADLERVQEGWLKRIYSDEQALKRRTEIDLAIGETERDLRKANMALEEQGFDEDQEKLDIVVYTLSQPGMHIASLCREVKDGEKTIYEPTGEVGPSDPYMALAPLFPNRIAHAMTAVPTKRMTVAEFHRIALGFPIPEAEDGPGMRFIQVVQNLVKHVAINTEGRIVDYALRIQVPPPGAYEEFTSSENHTLNLNSITSPSKTVYSLPSMRTRPFSLAADFEPEATRSW